MALVLKRERESPIRIALGMSRNSPGASLYISSIVPITACPVGPIPDAVNPLITGQQALITTPEGNVALQCCT